MNKILQKLYKLVSYIITHKTISNITIKKQNFYLKIIA